MNIKQLKTGAAVLALAAALLTSQHASAHHQSGSAETVAIEACLALNPYAPAEAVDVREDGMGDYLIWVEDADRGLWMCNASAAGLVYFNTPMAGDLLEGQGAQLIEASLENAEPATRAEDLCLMVLAGSGTNGNIVASVEDGFGERLVWLETENGYFACNASGQGELFAFEWVDAPIDMPADEEMV